MIYLQLFWSFVQIGLFSFGGGYSMLPLIQQQVVTQYGWLTLREFTDVVTISQMTPGPIALNAATFVGTKLAGPLGAVVATLGCSLPTAILALIVGLLYYKYRSLTMVRGIFDGIRPSVVSLIATAGLSILLLALFNTEIITLSTLYNIDWKAIIIFIAGLVVLRVWKPNPIYIMLGSGIIGVVVYYFM